MGEKMANVEILRKLDQGVEAWNKWRKDNPEILLNFRKADLKNRNLQGYDFSLADFHEADLSGSDLSGVNFHGSDLSEAVLKKTKLMGANFCRADLYKSDLSESDLNRANLKGSQLAETNLQATKLIGCEIYGSSAWDLKLENTIQRDLVISHSYNTKITVDNIEVAQFIYLLLHNEKIRDVIDTIGKKAVLILGRFTQERKLILDGIKERLRDLDYLPILFDFEKPSDRDLTETISVLAHMSRFIIADLTDAKSIPQELQAIVPNLPSVVIQPIIYALDKEYSMFEHLKRYPWVLPTYKYKSSKQLLSAFKKEIINPIELKFQKEMKSSKR